jgi:hypothetical protein
MRVTRRPMARGYPYLRLAVVACAIATVIGCAASSPDGERSAATDVRATATAIVAALSTHDMTRVASFVDPALGVRFSPYPYVDTTSDRVVPASDVAALWERRDTTLWGSYDGTGDPIRLPYAAYHAKFVYDLDFLHAPRVAVDSQPMGRGNAINNIASAYPGATIVEYHWPGKDPSLGGMDWRSLWLVLRRTGERWYLVGIVHGAWTI